MKKFGLISVCELLFTVHIMHFGLNIHISVSSGIPGIKLRTTDSGEDNIAYPEYRVIVGDRVQLPCNITIPSKDDSITLILWYRGDTTGAPIYTVDARQVQVKQTKHFLSDDLVNRATLNITVRPAILTIDPVRGEDEGEYRCRVDFRWGRTMNTVVSLIVIVPPRKVIIKNEKQEPLSDLAGPYDEDSDVRLTCEAKGARPPAVVQWFRDNIMIDDSHEIIQEGARVRNELLINKVNRNDLFAVFRCQAFNTNSSIPVVSKVVLDINLRPLNVEILSTNQPLIAGRKIDIICQSLGSRPLAQITWYKNKRKLLYPRESFSEVSNTTRSVITLTPVPDDNGSQLVCKAENTRIINSTIEDMWTLNVHYEPKVSLVMMTNHKNSIVAEGNEVVMDCKTKANPAVIDHTWFYEERMIKSDSVREVFIDNASLIIKKVNRHHNGKYYCLANNLVGRGKSNDLLLTVDYAPFCKSGQKIVYGIGIGETAKILCDIDARPSQVYFHWTFNNTHNQNLKFFSEGLRSSLSYTPTKRDDFGFVSCWAKNVVGSQQVPCVYTLIPAGRPEPVVKCTSSNHGLTSFLINCIPGYDGGLQQSFALELYDNRDGKSVLNITDSTVSSFELTALQPATHYDIKVFSFNVKGKSEPFLYSAKTSVPPIVLEESHESNETNDLIQNLVIIAFILLFITFLIIIICKILQKYRRKMLECDEEQSDKNEDILQYMDNMRDCKSIHHVNGVLPQEYMQSSANTTSNYLNDKTLSKRLSTKMQFDRHYYEENEPQFQECDDFYNHQNFKDFVIEDNQREIPFRINDDFHRWSPNESCDQNDIELIYPSDSVQFHMNNAILVNNHIKSANKRLKTSYTSTPV